MKQISLAPSTELALIAISVKPFSHWVADFGYYQKDRAGQRNREDKFDRSMVEKISLETPQSRTSMQMMRLPTLGLQPHRVFTLEEIDDATNNFDAANLMGEGSQGLFYKG
ncbi:hypothetical protein L3X38_042436 [Prunus dulcis]|uniref:Uncharacterized protein n=1 Tax=Prunus dulcis TaxID=3755 RepID=A0AAD4UWV5_PRUDU|nr:hypothetical protein L3X38_042436 [Prunus dulcis]